MRYRAAVQAVTIAVLWLGVLAPVAGADDTETFFLGPDGVPVASLIGTPHGGQMPNYDRGRDLEPGLFLQRSDLGLLETDETRYQHWQTEMSGRRLVGYPTLILWSAAAGFDAELRGVFSAFVLDCPASGVACAELASEELTVSPSEVGAWTEATIALPQIDHVFGEGHHLGIRIVVSEKSETDMIFAYGYPKYRSRLIISSEPPPVVAEASVASPPSTLASRERLERVKPVSPARLSAQQAADIDSLTPWLATLTGSTVILVALGVVLVFTLSPHGRRERTRSGARGPRSQHRTVISS
jgi:hypothetical protein